MAEGELGRFVKNFGSEAGGGNPGASLPGRESPAVLPIGQIEKGPGLNGSNRTLYLVA